MAHLHNLHVGFLQLHVCVTLSMENVLPTVCHYGTYSSSFACSQPHSIMSGICTFAMHLCHNQPPWIHAYLICWIKPGCERGSCLMLTVACHLKWAALSLVNKFMFIFGIINFHQNFLQNINMLRSDCHNLIRVFCKYLQHN